jgi:predicted nucleic acid-binding protein
LLINLARIAKLDLLRQLYGELAIPEAVWQEVVVSDALYMRVLQDEGEV